MESNTPHFSADASAGARLGTLMLTPTQALLAGFEHEPAASAEQAEAAATRPYASSRVAGEQIRQGFRIGDLNLMIRYEDGSELADLPLVYRLPNAPAWFHGMTNLHGALIPVFGLAEYLGMGRHVGLKSHDGVARMMLVMGSGVDAAGVLIDGLPQRLRFRGEHRIDDAPLPAQLEEHVAGAYWIDEQVWMDFKPADLFNRFEAKLGHAQ